MTSAPRKSRRRSGRLIVLLLFLLALASPFIGFHKEILSGLSDHDSIRLERWQRVTYAALDWTWPGTPNFDTFDKRLTAAGSKLGDPVLVRIFKREFQFEVWFKKGERFQRFETYPICKWSGRLGPKVRQGDHQAPEGFYTVDQRALNPKSRWHKSFNLGYPNTHDRAHKRTGSYLMVHGGCSSVGCYAMTNDAIDEIWKVVSASLGGGQKRFQVQVYPFRMTEANLQRYAGSAAAEFWRSLKPGYDLFEETGIPPRVSVCDRRYAFEAGAANSDGSAALETRCPATTAPTAQAPGAAG